MPRKPRLEQDALPFDVPIAPVGGASRPSTTRVAAEGPRRGRPRKWANEAERKRAYRQRLAADLGDPERLRRELRNERKKVANRDGEVARLRRELALAEARIHAAGRRQAELEAMVETLEARVEDWQSRAHSLIDALGAERQRRADLRSEPRP